MVCSLAAPSVSSADRPTFIAHAQGAHGQAAGGGCRHEGGHPIPGGHQPGGMQPRADLGPNYSQQGINDWEMDDGGAARKYGGHGVHGSIGGQYYARSAVYGGGLQRHRYPAAVWVQQQRWFGGQQGGQQQHEG